MPIFDHRCRVCGYTWEAFVHNSAPNPRCIRCGGETIHVIVPAVSLPKRESKGERRMRSVGEVEKRVTGDVRILNNRLLDISNRLAVKLQKHAVAKTPQGRILVALFKKAVNTFRGIQRLKAERLIEESWVLLRVLLETHINLVFFLKNDATELAKRWADASILEKLKYLREVNFYEGTEMAHMARRDQWEALAGEIECRYSREEFRALKRHGFSATSVQGRAEAVGLGAKYQHLYRIASRSTHMFDPAETGMMDYTKDEGVVDGLLRSRRGAIDSAQNMLLGRLSMLLSDVVKDAQIEIELALLGLGYEKYRDEVDGKSTTVDAEDSEAFYMWRE